MANLSNINNKFLVTTTGEVLVGRTAATGTSKLQVSGSLLIGTDINSGIPLVVQETTAAGFAIGFMRNTNATNGNGLVIDVNSTGGAYIQDWRQASIVKMRLLQNGNLGIGTDSPTNGKLVINKNSSAASFGGNILQLFENFNTTDGQMMSIGFRNNNSVGTTAYIDAVAYDQSIGATDIRFSTYSGSGWNSNMVTFQHTGRVGIGTVSPNTKLHISSASLSDIRLENTGTAIGSGENYGQIEWEGNDYNTGANGIRASIQVKGYGAGTQGETGMYFRTSYIGADSNVDRMVISHLGNVGIGTNSPDYKLEVESTTDADLVSIKSTAIANNTQLRLGISGNDSVISGTGGSTGSLVFKTYGSERMRIYSGGSVNIQSVLTVGAARTSTDGLILAGSNNNFRLLYNNTTSFRGNHGWRQLQFGNNGSNDIIAGNTVAGGYLRFFVNNTNDTESITTPNGIQAMTILATGNVGIGTTSPANKLHIIANTAGIEYDTGAGVRVDNAASSPDVSIMMAVSSANNIGIIQTLEPTVSWSTKNLAIQPRGGNVGIGTDSPGQKLEVVGIVKHEGLDMTTGIQVDQIATFNQTLTCLANTWTDTGVQGSVIGSGHFMIGCYSNYYSNAPNWYSMYWTGTMSWFNGTTNGSFASDIFLNKVGHSDNGRTLELRTLIDYASIPKLQFKLNVAATNFTIRFIVRRLI